MIEEQNPQGINENSGDPKKTEDSEEDTKETRESKDLQPKEKFEEEVQDDETDSVSEKAEDEVEIMDLSAESDKYADIDLEDDEQLKNMLKNFSDIEDLSMEEMLEIQSAIDDVMEDASEEGTVDSIAEVVPSEAFEEDPYEGWGLYEEIKPEFKPEISEDLETLIQEELEKKREQKKIVSVEEFKQYCMERRTKIWYHGLWTLVFDMEDHQAQKDTLYELLKEVTSKNPIDPILEHKFYFGLGFILRLSLNGKKIIEFRGEKLKLNVGIDVLNDILHEVGPPISERPILTKEERKKMFIDFLTDDFKDI